MPERPIELNNIPPEALCPLGNPDGKTGHHIKINTPKGPTSVGKCRDCTFERIYRNSPESDFYGDGKKIYSVVARSGKGPKGIVPGEIERRITQGFTVRGKQLA